MKDIKIVFNNLIKNLKKDGWSEIAPYYTNNKLIGIILIHDDVNAELKLELLVPDEE